MLREVHPDIPVLFLDTFHHFAQTLAYRDELTARWGLNLINLQAKTPSVGLWQAESTEACCKRHKVEPLFSALEGYDTWFTALRRDQSPSRANLQEVEPSSCREDDLARRAACRLDGTRRVGIREGSTTSRCCRSTNWATRASAASRARQLPFDPENPRSGRWQGQKLECGIHIQAK